MIEVTYRFPPNIDAHKQAKIIAVGQTVGSWGASFSHREKELQSHLAQVLSVEQSSRGENSYATIGFPEINTENDIATLLTMIFGKFSLAGPARITEIKLPDSYGTSPKFGIEGIRKLTQVYDRPFIMGIFKPALGLNASDHADLLRTVASAGLDIIKDDEINFNLKTAPTLERVKACSKVIQEVKTATGKEVLYAVNLSGKANELVNNAKQLIDAGANALLFNVISYGYSCLEAIAASPEINVPIFTHPAFSGALGGATDNSGEYGIDYSILLGTLMKYAGADAVLCPAHYGSLPFAKETEFKIRDLLRSHTPAHPAILPVPSAGIHPGIIGKAFRDYGNDVAFNAGSAIFDHPNGAGEGTKAFFQALQLAQQDKPVKIDLATDTALKAALEKWGEEQ